jgi:hypothetical protein
LEDELNSATSTGGGPESEFRGVFQDEKALELLLSSPSTLQEKAGRAYIIGNEGLSIPGFSDDDTLAQQNPRLTNLEIQNLRQELTQNRVLVSLATGDRPSVHDYAVTYVVSAANEGVKNIVGSTLEYFVLGDLTLTITEDG